MCKRCGYSFLAGASFVAGVTLGAFYVTQRALEWQWERRWSDGKKRTQDFWEKGGFLHG